MLKYRLKNQSQLADVPTLYQGFFLFNHFLLTSYMNRTPGAPKVNTHCIFSSGKNSLSMQRPKKPKN
jgi:hypothetical protein